jgi:hypothetical protein
MAPTIYHGTPMTPRAALEAVLRGRGACVSFYRPDDVVAVEAVCPFIMYDHGGFSFWMQAMRAGNEWDEASRDAWWLAYYDWLAERLFLPGRWAVVPDSPGAPSQLNDALLNDWPFGRSKGAPLWHMDGPLERLGRLCDRYDRVCLGWIGHPKKEPVGCDAYRRRMDEVSAFLGNYWPPLHMMRGVAVARDYPFRRRRRDDSRAKRVALRLPGRGHRPAFDVRPAAARRTMARAQRLCRQTGARP